MPLGQAKAVIQNGIPGDSEGYEGEIRYVKDKGSVYQFIRIGNKWSSIKVIGGVSAVQQEETSQTITVQEKVIQSTNVSSNSLRVLVLCGVSFTFHTSHNTIDPCW